MNFYTETNYNGELWLRDTNDNVLPAYQLLSSIYEKYKDINSTFYNDLTSNIIKKFDVFYDSFYIETNNGYFFEKYFIQNSLIYPYSQVNNYNYSTLNTDYWFDEINKKIYYINTNIQNYLVSPVENSSLLAYAFTFKVFDIQTGISKTLLDESLIFDVLYPQNLLDLSDLKEDPKLTYNKDTNNFNISFIVRNNINQMGLISIILNETEIKKIDAFIPFGTLRIHEEIPVTPPSTPTPTPTPTATYVTLPTPTPTQSLMPLVPTSTPTPTPSQTIPAVKSLYISFN
jgi:hypothetical protein